MKKILAERQALEKKWQNSPSEPGWTKKEFEDAMKIIEKNRIKNMEKLPTLPPPSPGPCSFCLQDIGSNGYVYYPGGVIQCFPCRKKQEEPKRVRKASKMPQVEFGKS